MRLLQALQYYDELLFLWLFQRRSYSSLVAASRWVSHSGDGYAYVAAAFLAYWIDSERGSRFVATLAAAFALERPLYFILKNTLKRGRPYTRIGNLGRLIVPSDEFSFPSGHTSAAFLVMVISGWFYPMFLPWLLVWAAAVGLARVLLGVHYPADVLAGALIGSGCALGAIAWIAL